MSTPDPAATEWVPLAGLVGPEGPAGPQGSQGPQGPAGPSSSTWMTGDTKVSMQGASHADPAGGQWLLADGSAIPAQYTALIALCGANVPDARGRGLVMLGTNADVNAIGKSDGVALASRSPKHKSSVADPTHTHGYNRGKATDTWQVGAQPGPYAGSDFVATAAAGTGITVGPAASAMIDTGAFTVVGNLFVHT